MIYIIFYFITIIIIIIIIIIRITCGQIHDYLCDKDTIRGTKGYTFGWRFSSQMHSISSKTFNRIVSVFVNQTIKFISINLLIKDDVFSIRECIFLEL